MTVNEQPIFEEKQYLGFNRLSMMRRLLMTLFSFGVYWWKRMQGQDGDLFFWLGFGIIVLSMLLLFVPHFRIRVYAQRMEINGLLMGKTVAISIKDIKKVVRTRYSKYHLNNPVFNLKWKGTVKFYTDGVEAVEVTDATGLPYRIGTHMPARLESILKELSNAA